MKHEGQSTYPFSQRCGPMLFALHKDVIIEPQPVDKLPYVEPTERVLKLDESDCRDESAIKVWVRMKGRTGNTAPRVESGRSNL